MIKQANLLKILKILLCSPIKLINLFQVAVSYVFLKGRIWGVPPVLILEPTTYCQLKCPLCILQNKDFNRPNKHLDIDLVKKMLTEIGPKISVALLYNQGEPMLHPELPEIIKLLKKYNIFVKISTNGNYKIDSANQLIHSGLDHIIFDVDGDTQESYEKYRIGGSLERLLSNIKTLSQAKSSLGVKTPFIEARLIAMKHNIEKIDKVKTLLDDCGVDSFTIKKCMVRKEERFPGASSFIPEEFNRLNSKSPKTCFYPWVYFCVLSNGKVSPCCYDEEGKHIFGNIQTEKIKKIISGTGYTNFRRLARQDTSRVSLCASCDIGDEFYMKYEEFKKIKSHGK